MVVLMVVVGSGDRVVRSAGGLIWVVEAGATDAGEV